jgi:hypothetical protein
MKKRNTQIGWGCFPCLMLIFLFASMPGFSQVLLREDFKNLDDWKSVFFKSIQRHSTYTCRQEQGITFLEGYAKAAASGLEHEVIFNPYKYPVVEWRWKIRNVYKSGDAKRKAGDDYPIRLYVNFPYNKEKAGFRKRLTYEFAKTQLGHYPPHSALAYIWANKKHKERIISNPYTDQEQMIVLRAEESDAGRWLVETIDIIRDYRKAFGENPPRKAKVAFMVGSSNTGEEGLSFIDYIEIRGRARKVLPRIDAASRNEDRMTDNK